MTSRDRLGASNGSAKPSKRTRSPLPFRAKIDIPYRSAGLSNLHVRSLQVLPLGLSYSLRSRWSCETNNHPPNDLGQGIRHRNSGSGKCRPGSWESGMWALIVDAPVVVVFDPFLIVVSSNDQSHLVFVTFWVIAGIWGYLGRLNASPGWVSDPLVNRRMLHLWCVSLDYSVWLCVLTAACKDNFRHLYAS